jgi:HK97 family phage major capsid protein
VLAEGTLSAGGALVPTPLAGEIIDRARNVSRCIQAGARNIPMTSETLKVPRLTGSADPAWRAANATITEDDLTFDAVTFDAKSLALIVRASREVIEDSNPSVSDVVAQDLAAQVAIQLDFVMLHGSGASNQPTGILNQTGVGSTTLVSGNGDPAHYDDLLDQVQSVRALNHEPNAFIYAPRLSNSLAKLKETSIDAYLARPPSHDDGIRHSRRTRFPPT